MAAAPPPGSKEEKERSRLRRGRPAERARLCSSADRDTAGARDGSEIRGRAKNGNGKERARACRRRVSSAERGERPGNGDRRHEPRAVLIARQGGSRRAGAGAGRKERRDKIDAPGLSSGLA